jgi:alkylhydroperoxidase/carboxymuconolactone decarboxylase family protein YurZ
VELHHLAQSTERGVPFPPDPLAVASLEELAERGRALMQDVNGERSRQGYAASDNPVTYALYELAIQYDYGEIWFRPGLERRQRARVAVAAFTALRLPEQARRFGQAALDSRCIEYRDDRGDRADCAALRLPAGTQRAERAVGCIALTQAAVAACPTTS